MSKREAAWFLIGSKDYDSVRTENALLDGKVDDLQRIVVEKDGQIKECHDSRDRLNLVITNYSALQVSDKNSYKALEKYAKKQVRIGRVGWTIGIAGLLFGVIKSFK